MRILIAGGTSFVGRAIALAGLDAGHEVTVINRGQTPSDLPATVERLVGDRHGDLSALAGRTFDATVDSTAYLPGEVTALHEALGDRGGQHLQISSVSAYADTEIRGATEEQLSLHSDEGLDLAGPVTGSTYGPLKAACERRALELFGRDIAILRPTFVIGGHDATLRFPYWVERARLGGQVPVPDGDDVLMQYVDARDLGAFAIRVLEAGEPARVTVAAPDGGEPFVEVIERVVAHVAPAGTALRRVDPSGRPRSEVASAFPLWTGPGPELIMGLSTARARSLGFSARPLEESVDDVVAWWGGREWPGHWLAPADEAALFPAT